MKTATIVLTLILIVFTGCTQTPPLAPVAPSATVPATKTPVPSATPTLPAATPQLTVTPVPAVSTPIPEPPPATSFPDTPYELVSPDSLFAYLTDLTAIQPYSGLTLTVDQQTVEVPAAGLRGSRYDQALAAYTVVGDGAIFQNAIPRTRIPILRVHLEDAQPAGISTWEDLAHVDTAQLLLDTDILMNYVADGGFLVVTNSAYNYAMKRRLNEYNDDARVLNALLAPMGVTFSYGGGPDDAIALSVAEHPLTANASYLTFYAGNGVPLRVQTGLELIRAAGHPLSEEHCSLCPHPLKKSAPA